MNKNIKIILYPLITVLVFTLSGLFIYISINFVSNKISEIFTVNQERIEANIVKLNLEEYESVANRLNIEEPLIEESEEETSEDESDSLPQE